MFRARGAWIRLSRIRRERPFCTNRPSTSTGENGGEKVESDVQAYTKAYNEALKQLENPDFTTAAKLLFTMPPKRKKFGLDFHLVQFFFTCLPSLAIYLVAQYARSEMKRMDAELEVKKKREEEEENEKKRKEVENNPVLVEVRGRLDKLEEVIKEIAVESKKRASGSTTKDQDDGGTKTQPATAEPSKAQVRSEASSSGEKDHPSRPKSSESISGSGQEKSGLAPGTKDEAPKQDNKGTIRSSGSSLEDSKNQRKPV